MPWACSLQCRGSSRGRSSRTEDELPEATSVCHFARGRTGWPAVDAVRTLRRSGVPGAAAPGPPKPGLSHSARGAARTVASSRSRRSERISRMRLLRLRSYADYYPITDDVNCSSRQQSRMQHSSPPGLPGRSRSPNQSGAIGQRSSAHRALRQHPRRRAAVRLRGGAVRRARGRWRAVSAARAGRASSATARGVAGRFLSGGRGASVLAPFVGDDAERGRARAS